jgi:signal transduction histidine kinase
MTFERRLILVSLLVALPVAGLMAQAMDWLRARDAAAAIERVVTSQVNVALRERCEADPTWFLTGALEGRPRPTDPKPGPDDLPARPHLDDEPYQLFAYDDDLVPTSPVGVRFPSEFRTPFKAGTQWMVGPFNAPGGQGQQFAMRTGWEGGPCAVLLGRIGAPPYAHFYWWTLFVGVEILFSALFIAIGTPTVWRIRAVAQAAREAARSDWTVVVPSDGHDELTAVGAALNEASADLRRRIKDVADREDAHRRFVSRVADEVGQPLEVLAEGLAASAPPDATAPREAHGLAMHFGNLAAAARLRMHLGPTSLETVDLGHVVADVIRRQTVFARRAGVTIDVVSSPAPITCSADRSLVEQAIFNLIDNATRYNRPGGHVTVALAREARGFMVRITDNGPGVTDEQLASMTAIRRFRGDEGRADRVRQRGLGLALVWEVMERSGFQLTLRHAPGGGFEAEIRGTGSFSTDSAL